MQSTQFHSLPIRICEENCIANTHTHTCSQSTSNNKDSISIFLNLIFRLVVHRLRCPQLAFLWKAHHPNRSKWSLVVFATTHGPVWMASVERLPSLSYELVIFDEEDDTDDDDDEIYPKGFSFSKIVLVCSILLIWWVYRMDLSIVAKWKVLSWSHYVPIYRTHHHTTLDNSPTLFVKHEKDSVRFISWRVFDGGEANAYRGESTTNVDRQSLLHKFHARWISPWLNLRCRFEW